MSSTRNTPADKRTVAAARRWGFDLHTNAYRPGDGSSGLELAKTREELATKEVASVEPLGFLRDFDHLGVEEDDSSKKRPQRGSSGNQSPKKKAAKEPKKAKKTNSRDTTLLNNNTTIS